MRIFITGATGFIGGSVAVTLAEAGHRVAGLARSEDGAAALERLGIEPVRGTLDHGGVLAEAARTADAVINAADSDHGGAADALLAGMAGSGKTLIHTSGTSIVGHPTGGHLSEDVFDETTPFTPSPARAARVAIGEQVLHAEGLRGIVMCPSLIYGIGLGPGRHSMQIPWLIDSASARGAGCHLGPGLNRWSNVHIRDLAALYALVLERGAAGQLYFAENGENSMGELAAAIGTMLGFGPETRALTLEEASADWGAGPAANTMGSNSRVRATAARALGWTPTGPSAIQEISKGCYAREHAANR